MAEIKSTLDLVLERAERMAQTATNDLSQDNTHKKGMQLAAQFMDNTLDSLIDALNELPPDQQILLRQGMVAVLLRNIFLPRDASAQERTDKAVNGILNLAGGSGEMASICEEIRHITGQYHQHREQLKEQLEEQVRVQYEQLLAQQAGGMQQNQGVSPEMALQAKIKEEWSRLETELSDQYSQALDQHKTTVQERLG